MKLIYICSRYRGDDKYSVEFNIEAAQLMCRCVSEKSVIPIAPHLYFPQFLDDDKQEERDYALNIGKELIAQCRRMKVLVVDGIISEGMLEEIYEAQRLELPIDYLFVTKDQVKSIGEELKHMPIMNKD